MFVYVVEWRGGKGRLCDYYPFRDCLQAIGWARAVAHHVLSGGGRIYTVDHEGFEIPIHSVQAFLELGKSVGIVQDGNDTQVKVEVHEV